MDSTWDDFEKEFAEGIFQDADRIHEWEPPKDDPKIKLPPPATPWAWTKLSDLPLRPFLWRGKHFQRRTVGATIGAPGRGKTTFGLYEAVLMAKDGLSVYYLSGEEEQDELDRRVAATLEYHGITSLSGKLIIKSVNEAVMHVAIMDKNGPVLNYDVVAWISDEISSNNVDVFSVDPLVGFHSVPENGNAEMDFVVKAGFKAIAIKQNCHVELYHHPGKPKPGVIDTTVDDGRGASALIGAVRSARVLNFMTSAEAGKLGIEEDMRRLHVRVSNGKANMGPTGSTNWFKIAIMPYGLTDEIAVATEWHPAPVMDSITVEHMMECRRAAEGGNYRKSDQSNDWFGYKVAEIIGVNASKGQPGRAQVQSVIGTWIKNEVLKVVIKKDKRREQREFIEPGQFNDEPHQDTDELA